MKVRSNSSSQFMVSKMKNMSFSNLLAKTTFDFRSILKVGIILKTHLVGIKKIFSKTTKFSEKFKNKESLLFFSKTYVGSIIFKL